MLLQKKPNTDACRSLSPLKKSHYSVVLLKSRPPQCFLLKCQCGRHAGVEKQSLSPEVRSGWCREVSEEPLVFSISLPLPAALGTAAEVSGPRGTTKCPGTTDNGQTWTWVEGGKQALQCREASSWGFQNKAVKTISCVHNEQTQEAESSKTSWMRVTYRRTTAHFSKANLFFSLKWFVKAVMGKHFLLKKKVFCNIFFSVKKWMRNSKNRTINKLLLRVGQ